jgi:hypothetical protein
MSRKPVDIPFNKDGMTVGDLKTCTSALQQVLRDFDNFGDDPEEFHTRVLQIRGSYNPNA